MDLVNKTGINYDKVLELIRFCEPEKVKDYIIIVGDCNTDIKANSQWNGEINNISDSSLPVITVQTNEKIDYPFEITGVKEKGYLWYKVSNREELIVYLISHELRHLWQAINHVELDEHWSQRDADVYAKNKVDEWRKKQE